MSTNEKVNIQLLPFFNTVDVKLDIYCNLMHFFLHKTAITVFFPTFVFEKL